MSANIKKIIVTIMLIAIQIIALCNNVYSYTNDLYINARSAIAMDSKSKIVLYEKNSRELIPMASTTKIMTVLIAINYGNLNEKIEISSNAANIHGSQVGYKKGEKITLRELLYGLMLRSGNDAAIAIAEGISGSVEKFVDLMNEYAVEIGLRDTHFESPHGLDSNYHYTTAYDLALLTSIAKENDVFNKIVSTKDISAEQYGFTRSYHNINKILYLIPKANGVKTGYTGNAGKCLVSSIDYNNNDIVIVVLNCHQRWNETKKIYNYVNQNYSYKCLINSNKILGEISSKRLNKSIKLVSPVDVNIPIKKGANYLYRVVKPNFEMDVPIYKGMQIGHIDIVKVEKGEEVIMRINTVSNDDIDVKNGLLHYFDYIIEKISSK
ncbi:D-alanyl-D-alanine carboxypeptidase DacB precursor [Clostridium tepidiprofundi DSM 19306]|uniref:serine-type D-Ala-D-Ala carboxypeptidase n=1 Tax=Clostridium tepidiprofundi DSM 19306 TaxID=1121338 RepID=A0A151B7U4_9CLOT|nr:D-alanyl-D-alanine carboxypeptidase DacB precursor [Clostridium tepidiprofundi DSM 19306]